ncbi:MAG: hypothetical protein ABI585_16230 [Betaproteobacteria bacterium]
MAVTLCPIAIAVGCRRCPVFKVCPVKTVIGDMRPKPEVPVTATAAAARAGKDPERSHARQKRRGRRSHAKGRDRKAGARVGSRTP